MVTAEESGNSEIPGLCLFNNDIKVDAMKDGREHAARLGFADLFVDIKINADEDDNEEGRRSVEAEM